MSRAKFRMRLLAAIVGVFAACSGIQADPPDSPAANGATKTSPILPGRDPERPCAIAETSSCSPAISTQFLGENWSGFWGLSHLEMNLLLPPRDF